MAQLVSFYQDHPRDLGKHVELEQRPTDEMALFSCTEGRISHNTVYVLVPHQGVDLLIPFGRYDDWLMRAKYNEALRIMTSLGAAQIECLAFRKREQRARLSLLKGRRGAEVTVERARDSKYEFRHVGIGSAPRDPAPIAWPDEPGFQAARNSVIQNGATTVSINIHGSEAYRFDSTLGLRLRKLRFHLGVDGVIDNVDSLSIVATFPPRHR